MAQRRDRLVGRGELPDQLPGLEAIYLEGVYVHPEERGKGYGLRCVSQLGRLLLQRANSVCVLVNELNEAGQFFYRRAGYKLAGTYDTIYLKSDRQ